MYESSHKHIVQRAETQSLWGGQIKMSSIPSETSLNFNHLDSITGSDPQTFRRPKAHSSTHATASCPLYLCTMRARRTESVCLHTL